MSRQLLAMVAVAVAVVWAANNVQAVRRVIG